MNQKALAVISFGTTYTLAQDAIMQIESTLSCHVKKNMIVSAHLPPKW